MRKVATRTIASTIVLAAALLGGTASAQAVGSADDGAQPTPVDSSTIVVTAQRREERARDVPISITALSGENLVAAGIEKVEDLQKVTPGMRIERIGVYSIPALRGVVTTVTDPTADSPVGIYLDGVYQPGLSSNNFDLPDVERVEVLKGPQGTLFGRNTSGGAIQIITKSPSYELAGSVTASYGNFDRIGIKGFVTGPIVRDRLAVSIAGLFTHGESYYNNIVPGGPQPEDEETKMFRGKLRFDPSDDLRVDLSGRYSKARTSVLYAALNGNSLNKLLDPDTITPDRPFDVALNSVSGLTVESWDVSGKFSLDVGSGTVASITAYKEATTAQLQDSDGGYGPSGVSNIFNANQAENWFSQELTFSSDLGGPFNFVVGAFYIDGQADWDPIGVAPNNIAIYSDGKVEAVAGFGEVTYEISDQLTAIAGLRYSWEQRSLTNGVYGPGIDAPMSDATTFVPFADLGERSDDGWTPRISLRYAVTPNDNIYAAYGKGFKSGLINSNYVGPPSTLDTVDPETVTSYEIGYKGVPADWLTLNLAAFYYDQKNVQQNLYQFIPDGQGGQVALSILRNAASVRNYGFEADAVITFSPGFNIAFAGLYLDSEFTDFPDAIRNIPIVDPVLGLSGNTPVPYDATGQTNLRSPKLTFSVSPTFKIDAFGGVVQASSTIYYSSRSFFSFDHRLSQDPYATVDARISYSPDNSGLTLAVFGSNLFDEEIFQGIFEFPTGDNALYKPPRMYGASVSVDF